MGFAELLAKVQALPPERQAEVMDFVDFLATRPPAAIPRSDAPPNGAAMAEIFAQLAALGVGNDFGDPVEWQKSVRADRPLPGRDA